MQSRKPPIAADPERAEPSEGELNPEELPPEELERLFSAQLGPGAPDPAPLRDVPPGVPTNLDTYEGSKSHEVRKVLAGPAAPEVSGAWRERAFVPRGTMPKEEVLAGLEKAVEVVAMQRRADAARAQLRSEWMPLLRQAVEQAGGDGLDAYLEAILSPPGKGGRDRFVRELASSMQRLSSARGVPELLAAARSVIGLVREAFQTGQRVSLRYLDKVLDGRIEVHGVLAILFSTDDELTKHLGDVDKALESLRAQLKALPGSAPQGMLSSFARLKAERRVLEAELAQRAPR